uniref:Uncharacterized protein n=1 Tax=Arundo donax TaxID=35708 RepID=A0A0A9F926_ARUDO
MLVWIVAVIPFYEQEGLYYTLTLVLINMNPNHTVYMLIGRLTIC